MKTIAKAQRIGLACPTLMAVALLVAGAAVGWLGCGKRESARADSRNAQEKGQGDQSLSADANAVARILFEKAPACLSCGSQHCAELVSGCVELKGAAEAGPAKNRPKAELCRETLACVLKGKCVAGDASYKCYCGSVPGEQCLGTTKADGPCKSLLEAGLESTSSGEIARVWGDSTKGGGAAMALVLCLADHKCKACF